MRKLLSLYNFLFKSYKGFNVRNHRKNCICLCVCSAISFFSKAAEKRLVAKEHARCYGVGLTRWRPCIATLVPMDTRRHVEEAWGVLSGSYVFSSINQLEYTTCTYVVSSVERRQYWRESKGPGTLCGFLRNLRCTLQRRVHSATRSTLCNQLQQRPSALPSSVTPLWQLFHAICTVYYHQRMRVPLPSIQDETFWSR